MDFRYHTVMMLLVSDVKRPVAGGIRKAFWGTTVGLQGAWENLFEQFFKENSTCRSSSGCVFVFCNYSKDLPLI